MGEKQIMNDFREVNNVVTFSAHQSTSSSVGREHQHQTKLLHKADMTEEQLHPPDGWNNIMKYRKPVVPQCPLVSLDYVPVVFTDI